MAMLAGATVHSFFAVWPSHLVRRLSLAVLVTGSLWGLLIGSASAQAPARLTPVSGSGQSTTVDTVFANPLKVIVQDGSGNTLPNVAVTFTAPAGTASTTPTAIFNGAGNTITVNSDGSGTATVPAALVKASQRAAQYTVNVTAGSVTSTISLINAPGPAATISVSQGAGQQGTISTSLPTSFIALVVDGFGNPAPGVGVTFTAPSSGASGTFSGSLTSLTTTNSSGLATAAAFSFNSTAGVFNVVANKTTAPLAVPANFNLISMPGAATQISTNQGAGQTTVISTNFTTVLQALVRDASNNPVPGVVVTFTAPALGATATFASGLATYTATTNASGIAITTTLTANATAGAFNISAAFPGGSVNFAMTNTPGAAASIAVNGGDNQSTTITLDYVTSLSVIVKDAGGNVVPGAVVTFAAPTTGASGLFGASTSATATSNARGIATATTFKANAIAGTYSITVTFGTLSTTFISITNLNPSAIAVNGPASQSTTITTAFGTLLSAKVTGAGGVAIPGLVVTFTAPGTGASGTFGGALTKTATTDTNGIATATAFTANGTSGTYTVDATVTGVGTAASFSLTNSNPFSIVAQLGNNQQTTISTNYLAKLTARVTNSNGNGIAGLVVTFTAPGSGASGLFGASLTSTATTNTSGDAVSATFKANATAGPVVVNASVAGIGTPAAFNLTNLTPVVTSMTASAAAGTPQSTSINTAFSTAIGVLVKDLNAVIVPGASVLFTVNQVGGAGASFSSGATATVIANASGIATAPTLTANGVAGTYTVTVTSGTATFTFTLTNRAPSQITTNGGTPQVTLINTNFGTQLSAKVVDSGGFAVGGVTVTFTAPSSSFTGAFSGSATTTAVTDASGIATAAIIRANGTVGTYTVSASVSGVATTADFSLTNTTPTSITANAGSTPQLTIVSTSFGTLKATVRDATTAGVAGVTVTFTAPSSGASGLFGASLTASAVTDVSGVATAPAFIANSTVGGPYVVTASATGLTSANFSLTNIFATPATAVASPSNGTPQSTAVNTAFATALGILVKDGSGAIIAGLPVTFTVNPVGGAGGSFAGGSTETVNTNASGIATASAFTANGVAGSYQVIATVGTLTVTFQLSNTAVPGSIVPFAGDGQSAQINATFTNLLQAKVTDASGAVISGAVVVFSAPTTGARATFGGASSATAVTNAAGIATAPTALAGTVTGGYPITATVQGTTIKTTFTLTNAPGAVSTIAQVSGSGQSAPLGADFAQPLVAVVKDGNGNVIPGVSVTFNAPTTGAKATFAGGLSSVTVTTDTSGNATSTLLISSGATGPVTISAKVNNTAPSVNFTLTNNAAAPGSVSLQSGGTQTTLVNTTFGATLQAKVLDTLGNPMQGVIVTFTVPTTGATGGFGGATTVTATTNATGIAISPALKANTVSGSFFAQATIPGVTTPAIYTMTNTPDSPVAIAIVSGTPQSTIVGTAFAAPLIAQVKDVFGNVVPGATITFLAPTVGAVGSFTGPTNSATVTTDTSGKATSPTLTGNLIAGSYTVSASIPGVAFVNFNLTNTPAPASIVASGASTQTTPITTSFGTALQVTVRDTSNLPVQGAIVTFAVVPATGGATATLSSLTATTNAAGVASVTATANGTAGSYQVTAGLAGVATQLSFKLTNTAGAASSVLVTGGGTQSTQISAAFVTALQATVRDASNNPVSGVVVTFVVVPASGGATAALSALTATTNASGAASVTATANATAGSYTVTATAAGITGTILTYNLTNTVGVPVSISVIGGGTQSTRVSTAFGTTLQVTVKDGSNNPVSGVAVTYVVVPAAGGATATLSALTATTNASGIASVTATANGASGGYVVNASAAGIATRLTFSLTNTAGSATSIVATGGVTQSTLISTAFGAQLQVTVKDTSGNPVSGVTVTFAAPTAGASATLSALTATTNAAGIASIAAIANGITGTFSVTASVAGIATPISFSMTNTGSPNLRLTVAGAPNIVSAPGQTVTFTYVVQNSGNLGVSGLVLADQRIPGVICPVTTLAVNASMTCTAPYVSKPADILNGGIVSVAQVTGTSPAGAAASTVVTTKVGVDADAVRKKTVDANKEFMQNRARALTSMAPNAQRLQHRLSDYIFGNPDEEDVVSPAPERGRIDTLKAFDTPGASSALAGRPAILTGRDGAIWGTQEPSIPGANLRHRSALPADIEYNGMPGEGSRSTTASPFSVGGDADERNGRLNFSASLSQMRTAALAQESAKLGVSEQSGVVTGRGSRRPGDDKLDIWVEGQSSYYTNDGIDGRRKGRASVLYAGSDMVVAPGVIIGVLYQRDWITESATALGQNRDGAGWMAGPYVGLRLTKSIYFDARFAWGTAINHVDPIGAYTDTFSTARKLASARLTGDWTHGAWRFRPSADLTYYTESQKSYVNQIGIDIPGSRISLGRITFGPEIGYRMQLPQQMVLEPYVGLKGVWDFAKNKDVSAGGVALAPDVLTGRLEIGASLKTASGVSFRAVGAYDGLGTSNYRAWQGQGFVIVPIK
jgi:adhesin/invasin